MGVMLDMQPHPIGLPHKRFNQCIDKMMNTGKLNPEILEYMNADQLLVINEIKKSLKRICRKANQ